MLSKSVSVGLALFSLSVLSDAGLQVPSAGEVLRAFDVPRSTAYEFKKRVGQALGKISPQPGRPVLPPAPQLKDDEIHVVRRDALRFVYEHPGAVSTGQSRQHYSDSFRAFVVQLAHAHPHLRMEQLAEALQVPLPTIKPWLRVAGPASPTRASTPTRSTASSSQSRCDGSSDSSASPADTSRHLPENHPAPARIQTVLDAWEHWHDKRRGFSAFCRHVRHHLRIELGTCAIRQILFAHGQRRVARRGRAPDASVNRQAFETFFPGAQWVGDGSELTVEVSGKRFHVNLELLVDTSTGAFVGANVRANEDATAVTQAFADGVATTSAEPLSVLLDNKPSNHGSQVTSAIGDALLLRPRPYTPTDKPHVEGAFGLFKSTAPDLVLRDGSGSDIAAQIARLVFITWARTMNHRPRPDRKGASRVQLYQEDSRVTPEQIAQARAALLERQRKQLKAMQTRARRTDPQVLELLDRAFQDLGLDDPQHYVRSAIASWPREAIVTGIAIFEGKLHAGTLPKGADARYLRGIVKNVAQQTEGNHIQQALIRRRLQARDISLASLQRQAHLVEHDNPNHMDRLKRLVSEAVNTDRTIDRTFWLLQTARLIQAQPDDSHASLLQLASRRILAHFKLPYRERFDAASQLAQLVITID